jgi:hypothetical protein
MNVSTSVAFHAPVVTRIISSNGRRNVVVTEHEVSMLTEQKPTSSFQLLFSKLVSQIPCIILVAQPLLGVQVEIFQISFQILRAFTVSIKTATCPFHRYLQHVAQYSNNINFRKTFVYCI